VTAPSERTAKNGRPPRSTVTNWYFSACAWPCRLSARGATSGAAAAGPTAAAAAEAARERACGAADLGGHGGGEGLADEALKMMTTFLVQRTASMALLKIRLTLAS
jgi:hypothetical protein